ncbi:MAG: polyamine ABC transporter substrate-binding protein [Candidatus Nanopelagicales bacterium]|jgi:spermidine/putrescine transport system substrate-binding protein
MTKRPLSPQAAAIVAMSRSSLSRRRLLQVAGITGVAATAAACGAGGGSSDESSAAPSPTQASDLSDSEKFVNWANWPLYIDVNDETGAYPTLEAFTATTGIDVNYTEDVNDNNEFYAKVRAQLEAGQSIDRDIVVLTDWMAALWINNGFAAKFDKALIPNAANLEPAYNGVAFDPNRDYTLPWFSGFGAFGWNKAALQETLGTGSLTSLDQLWDPALKGRITVLSEMRDTMGIIMAWQGADPSNFTDDQYQAGIAELQKQIDSGQIRQVAGNDYVAALETGDVIAVIGWSGDMFQLGDDYGVGLPESGGMLWTDNMLIPSVATHKKNAEAVMNYYYDPAVAAEVAAYVQYISPVAGAKEAMADIDPTLVDNQWIFPDQATLDNSYVFMTLTPEQDEAYQREFQKAIGL